MEQFKKNNSEESTSQKELRRLDDVARHNIEYVTLVIRNGNPRTSYTDALRIIKDYVGTLRNPDQKAGPQKPRMTHDHHILFAARVLQNRNGSTFFEALDALESAVDSLLADEEKKAEKRKNR